MAHERSIESTLGYSDIDGQVREWGLPNITTTPSDGQRETLAAVDDSGPEVSIPELTAQWDSTKSTITRQVNDLEADRFVTALTEDRTKHVSINLTGRLCPTRSDSW